MAREIDGPQAKSGGWLMAAAHFFDLINNSTGEIPYRRKKRTAAERPNEVFVATKFAPL
jgi:hypothetical protein